AHGNLSATEIRNGFREWGPFQYGNRQGHEFLASPTLSAIRLARGIWGIAESRRLLDGVLEQAEKSGGGLPPPLSALAKEVAFEDSMVAGLARVDLLRDKLPDQEERRNVRSL